MALTRSEVSQNFFFAESDGNVVSPDEIAERVYGLLSDAYGQMPILHLQGLLARFGGQWDSRTQQGFGEMVLSDLLQILEPHCKFFGTSDLVQHVVGNVLKLPSHSLDISETLEAIGWYAYWQISSVPLRQRSHEARWPRSGVTFPPEILR